MTRKRKRISERGLETRLARILENALDRRGGQVDTFEARGLLTRDRGLVVRLANGQEFQLTIVESTRG